MSFSWVNDFRDKERQGEGKSLFFASAHQNDKNSNVKKKNKDTLDATAKE